MPDLKTTECENHNGGKARDLAEGGGIRRGFNKGTHRGLAAHFTG